MASAKSRQTTGSWQGARTNRLPPITALPLLAALLLALLGCAGGQPALADRSDAWLAPPPTTALPSTATATPATPATPTARLRPSSTAIVEATVPARLDGLPVITRAQLPREARDTIALIKRGGPFPYRQDDSVFQNRERLLPLRARGYYREYTVKTPGSPDRGARRIVTGEGGEFYYTLDHYSSFMRIWDP